YGTTTEPSPNDLLHLNEPLMDHREGQLFLTQAFKVIMEEMLWKGTDNLLKHCHSANTTYLFQQDKFYDMSLDTGDKSIQCGRKVDCLNLWLMWKAVGSHGLAERVDRAFAHTRYNHIAYTLYLHGLRGKENSPDDQNRLSEVSPVIKERMMQGTMMVSYQPQGGRVNFFRMIVVSPQLSQQDMICFLDEIERLGNDL
ncbi:unnamed protein product, partial [Coregonus sp. 'balchen']